MEPSRSRSSTHAEKREPPKLGDDSFLIGKRVLVAEDDPSARRIVATALRAMGLDVLETGDGGRMLVAVSAHYKGGLTPAALDLIVTDVHMPVLDGLSVFWGIRAAHWTTPTIVVTGDDSLEVRQAAARLGAIVLSKPLELDLLESTVRELLAPRSPPPIPRSTSKPH